MLKVYNTLGRSLQDFKPLKDGYITFYQCGPTVYSRQHIGNLFSAVKGDLIRRSLMYLGYEVKYVRNITDVGHMVSDADSGEDKMAKGSKREGLSPEEIAKKYTDLYHQDLTKLNVLEPSVETVASKYVEEMADIVQTLIDKGYAYATDLAIYYDVSKFPTYTDLSGQKLEENLEGAGHGDVSDPDKKHVYDFAVWFFKAGTHANALQTWDISFEGIEQKVIAGFPGWHIECSAMSKDTLGDTIDIHMGGPEHIPVHHTNEIAQSESANSVKYTNYWLHHEWLLIDGGKMSKSLGNVYLVDDLEEKGFSALDYRYFLLQAHYRSKQNFTFEALEGARNAYRRLREKVREIKSTIDPLAEISEPDTAYTDKFKEQLADDFNIPGALATLWDVIKSDLEASVKLATVLDLDKVLGLKLESYLEDPEELIIPDGAQTLLLERTVARNEKSWMVADEIRGRLKAEYGLDVEDTPEGQRVKRI